MLLFLLVSVIWLIYTFIVTVMVHWFVLLQVGGVILSIVILVGGSLFTLGVLGESLLKLIDWFDKKKKGENK